MLINVFIDQQISEVYNFFFKLFGKLDVCNEKNILEGRISNNKVIINIYLNGPRNKPYAHIR